MGAVRASDYSEKSVNEEAWSLRLKKKNLMELLKICWQKKNKYPK